MAAPLITHGTVISGIISGTVKTFTPPTESGLKVDMTGVSDTVRKYADGNLLERGQFDLTVVREAGVALPAVSAEGEIRIVYAATTANGAGTVAVSGTAVTGTGTNFTAGDIGKTITVGGQAAKISAVASTTAATLSTAFAVAAPAGSSYKLVAATDVDTAKVRIESVGRPTGSVGSTEPLAYSVSAYIID